MGRKISGLHAFIGAVAGTAGFITGVVMMVNTFCFSCDLDERRAYGYAQSLTLVSLLVLVAALIFAVKAFRRRDGRSWAIAGLCLSSVPLAAGATILIVALALSAS